MVPVTRNQGKGQSMAIGSITLFSGRVKSTLTGIAGFAKGCDDATNGSSNTKRTAKNKLFRIDSKI
jgi:hypothetical protein